MATLNPIFATGKEQYAAIQCKFFARDTLVVKAHVDSFLASSNLDFIKERYLLVTSNKVSFNLSLECDHQSKPIYIITNSILAHSSINWSKYLRDNLVESLPVLVLRDYQEHAVQSIVQGFVEHDRGTLVMACGSGKTLVALRAIERMAEPSDLIIYWVPSLSLLAQALHDWKNNSLYPLHTFAVCSDRTIGHSIVSSKAGDATAEIDLGFGRDLDLKTDSSVRDSSGSEIEDDIDDFFGASDLNYPCTTDPQVLAIQVRKALMQSKVSSVNGLTGANEQNQDPTVIFATYQSSAVIALAQHFFGLPEFAYAIHDEAHRTASGRLHSGKVLEPYYNCCDLSENMSAAEKALLVVSRWGYGLGIVDDNESCFTRVHNDQYIHCRKRLYMTATPRIFADGVKMQSLQHGTAVYSMDDKTIFGPVFFTFSFAEAVKYGCLSEVKVLALVIDPRALWDITEIRDIASSHQSMMLSTWLLLNKFGLKINEEEDGEPLRRVIAYARRIHPDDENDAISAKYYAANMQRMISNFRKYVLTHKDAAVDVTGLVDAVYASAQSNLDAEAYQFVRTHDMVCDCRYIESSMSEFERGDILEWLASDASDSSKEHDHGHDNAQAQHVCKVLFNVRCLSEGVDVPALDGVVILAQLRSPLEIVQVLGRAMRKAKGKRYGYVLLPLVAPEPGKVESILRSDGGINKLLSVLSAMSAFMGTMESDHQQLLAKLIANTNISFLAPARASGRHSGYSSSIEQAIRRAKGKANLAKFSAMDSENGLISDLQSEVAIMLRAALLNQVGLGQNWLAVGDELGLLCVKQLQLLKDFVHSKISKTSQGYVQAPSLVLRYFEQQQKRLSLSINHELSYGEMCEVLAQHIVICPIVSMLYRKVLRADMGVCLPLSKELESVVASLKSAGLATVNADLHSLYHKVEQRLEYALGEQERRDLIVALFERIIQALFKHNGFSTVTLATPVEVIDFAHQSLNLLLKDKFDCCLSDAKVHIVDPFAGSGYFISRLLQHPDLIKDQDVVRKCRHELHAFELMPAAYYLAAFNLEVVSHDRMVQSKAQAQDVAHHSIMVLTDSFELREQTAFSAKVALSSELEANRSLRTQLDQLDVVVDGGLKVIIGAPPFSGGFSEQIETKFKRRQRGSSPYVELDDRVIASYASNRVSMKSLSLKEAYLRGLRWASDYVGQHGVVALVINASARFEKFIQNE